jgi:hypothetical protein
MALQAIPLEIQEQYDKQLKDLHEAYGEANLDLCARQKFLALLGEPLSAIGPRTVTREDGK